MASGMARVMMGALIGLLCSCARVEHRQELQQAADEMERATGLRPLWAASSDLQEAGLGEGATLPLERAIELTLANNRSLRGDLEVIGQAKADLVQAGLLSNPLLSLMLRFPEGGGRADVDFGLTKDFADLWLIPSRKRAAQAMLQQRVLSFTDTVIALVTEVRTIYHALQYQSLAINLQERNLQILLESMEIAQARLRAGDTSQLDVNLIRARYLEAEIDLLQLHSDADVNRRTLLRLMGVAKATDAWGPNPLAFGGSFPQVAADESRLVEAALLQRLDVQAARWELESAVADFQQQRLRVIPSLGIGVSADRFESRGMGGRKILADTARASIANGGLTAPDLESAGQRRQERSQEIDMILGPTIEVPLPIFDQNQAQIAKTQFRARELEQRYEEVEQRVIEGVRSALVQRRLAEERARFFRDSLVPLLESNLELAQSAYRAGRESILTVLLAQQELIRTRLGYAGALRDLDISAANLERQLSGRLTQLTPAPSTTQPATQPSSDHAEPDVSAAPASGGGDMIIQESRGVLAYELSTQE